MTLEQTPFFRFQPHAYTNGIFEVNHEKKNCSVCKNTSDYMYYGPFYSIEDLNGICPVCIHNGKASENFNGFFQGGIEYRGSSLSVSYDESTNKFLYFLGYDEFSLLEEPAIEELLFRTPGYVSWQESYWLTENNFPLAFVKYLSIEEIEDKLLSLSEALNELNENYGFNRDSTSEDVGLYLFESLSKKGKYRIHLDNT
ncbi:CbrC family protein [Paenibacillus xylanexedens]|uniref:CbrC family protein n=1 Tax=Paenibacillus xylanexedens TaxID=528191 RepID=UPI0011A22408|nr:CbrC family protein [Paenibacillus xylanexedens]